MQDYRARLHNVIPGGAHTYSRGDDQFPLNAPPILERGEGAYVWDLEGNRFLDYGMGLRSVNIGYGNKEVAEAVMQGVYKGNNLTRASLMELEAAELLAELIPSVDMVKFAKHGSTVTTAAIKLARAYTNRKYVAIPYEHPFFSFDDWFIGSTTLTRGTIEEASLYTLKFNYNDITSLENLFDQYPDQIACVMLEPATTVAPAIIENIPDHLKEAGDNHVKPHFLNLVQRLCNKNSSLFIIDEMITGFRWHLNGAQTLYGVEPDITTFGKAMANGFAVAALAGKREFMKIGGIFEEGAERVFLTSTTHGAEMSALGAFIKTIEILERDNIIDHFWMYGKKLMEKANAIAKQLNIHDNFYLEGAACSPNYVLKDNDGKISLPLRTLFAQEMINNKVMMPYLALSASHGEVELEITLNAIEQSLVVVKKALENGIEGYLHSPAIKPVFRKYN